jgi:hypothetical protein
MLNLLKIILLLFTRIDIALSVGIVDPNACHNDAMRTAQDLTILKNNNYTSVSILQEIQLKLKANFRNNVQTTPNAQMTTNNLQAQLINTAAPVQPIDTTTTPAISNFVAIGTGVGTVINGDVYVILNVNGDTYSLTNNNE